MAVHAVGCLDGCLGLNVCGGFVVCRCRILLYFRGGLEFDDFKQVLNQHKNRINPN